MNPQFHPSRLIVGHTGAVYGLCAGTHSSSVFSASGDRFIAEWNVTTGQQEPMAVRLEQPVFSVAHIHDAGLLIAGCGNGAMHVIDIVQKKELHNFTVHTKGIYDFHYNTKTQQLLVLGGDGWLSVWSVPDFKLLNKLQLGDGKLRQLAYSEQYGSYAVASADGNVYVLEPKNLISLYVINAHEQGATSVAWHPTKPVLLSGGRDALLKVWNVNSDYETLMELPAHNYAIYSIVFNETSDLIATGSRDKTIKIWDSATMDVLQRMDAKSGGHTHSVNRLVWQDGALISAGDDRKIIVWEQQ
jgi:WD40 repeat protein